MAHEPLLHVVLDRPRIAGNVGAMVRLVAGTGAALHICGELPFAPNNRKMWRAGLDYWAAARVHFHADIHRCLTLLGKTPWIVEVGGTLAPWDVSFSQGDVVVLGPEDGSVDASVIAAHRERLLTFPKRTVSRSFNLGQCTAAVVFEAVRQQGGVVEP